MASPCSNQPAPFSELFLLKGQIVNTISFVGVLLLSKLNSSFMMQKQPQTLQKRKGWLAEFQTSKQNFIDEKVGGLNLTIA